MNDLRHAFRQLCKHPFTSGVIVLTIALLTGAASVIYASILEDRAKLLPFPRADRIVKLWRVGEQRVEMLFPGDLTQGYLDTLRSFDAIGVSEWSGNFTLTGKGEPASYSGMKFSPEMFQIIDKQPVAGRFFEPDDAREQFGRTVVISETLWKEKFDADASCIGSSIQLNERDYTIIGVMPDAMRQTHIGFGIDLWMPLRIAAGSDSTQYYLFGRLKDDSSIRSAQAEVDVVAPRLEAQHAPATGEKAIHPWGFQSARVVAADETLMSNDGSVPPGYIATQVFGVVVMGSVVGIAGFNVTNLLLARSTARAREMAVRLALGAKRRRIAMLLLVESLMLAIAGGIVGLLASWWLMDLLRLQSIDARFDLRFYFVSLGGACVVGALAGMSPALRAARIDLNEAMKDTGQTFAGARRHRLRNFLVASEVAMAVILTITAGIFGRALVHMILPDVGFDSNRVVMVSVTPREDSYSEMEDRALYLERGLQHLRETPGIESAGVMGGTGELNSGMRTTIFLPDRELPEGESALAALQSISRELPELLGMPLLRGRVFSSDPAAARSEAVVNQCFVEQFFPEQDPLGQLIRTDQNAPWLTIVGVLANRGSVTSGFREMPDVFMDYRSNWSSEYTFVIRAQGDATALAPLARAQVMQLDPIQPVHPAVLMSDQIREAREGPMKGVLMLTSLAGFGLLLALMGVYGVVANSVVERTRELGIRMALGADRMRVLRLVARQGAMLLILGALPGLFIAAAVINALPLQNLMAGFNPRDPWTYALVMGLIAVTGCLAALLPARRATRINPMEALRHE